MLESAIRKSAGGQAKDNKGKMLVFFSSVALVLLLVAVIKSPREQPEGERLGSAHSLEGTAHRGGKGWTVLPVEVGARDVTSSHFDRSGNRARDQRWAQAYPSAPVLRDQFL